jgi:hypothetical protein
MHPLVIVVPVLGAVVAPRWWAKAQLRRFDVEDDAFLPADELARRLLDRHGLTLVPVEVTDLGDHYDPRAKAVRLNRAHFHRSSLSAATAAAHEVGHALQDASGDWTFRVHHWLARVAQVTTGVGTVLLVAVPAAAIASQTPAPPRVLSLAAVAMLGTGLVAQLAALPSELDASLTRALPLLRDSCLSDAQLRDARRILLACSLTYLASAAVPALALWPILGAPLRSAVMPGLMAPGPAMLAASRTARGRKRRAPARPAPPQRERPRSGVWRAAPSAPAATLRAGAETRAVQGSLARRYGLLRAVARPLVCGWLRATGDY